MILNPLYIIDAAKLNRVKHVYRIQNGGISRYWPGRRKSENTSFDRLWGAWTRYIDHRWSKV